MITHEARVGEIHKWMTSDRFKRTVSSPARTPLSWPLSHCFSVTPALHVTASPSTCVENCGPRFRGICDLLPPPDAHLTMPSCPHTPPQFRNYGAEDVARLRGSVEWPRPSSVCR